MSESHWLLEQVALLVPLILSLTVHEWAHAYSAFRLGDDTAEREGRLTLDPLKHIDLIGTILLPLAGIPFGWAKPVPVNPQRFRREISMRGGLVLTSLAGPFSNVVLALITAVLWGLLLRFGAHSVDVGSAAFILLQSTLIINLGLAVFNLLPIPPLDGGRIADGLMPARFERYWRAYCRYSPLVLLAIIVAPTVLHMSVLGWPIRQITRVAIWIVSMVAGDLSATLGHDGQTLVTQIPSAVGTAVFGRGALQILRSWRG